MTKLSTCIEASEDLYESINDIGMVGLVSASLSFIGSTSVVSFILWKKLFRSKRVLPLFHLSLADLMLSSLWILSTVLYFIRHKFTNAQSHAMCCFVCQLVTEMLHLVTFFLTINYSINVFFKTKDRTVQVHLITVGEQLLMSKTRECIQKLLYITSWCLPLILMMPIAVSIHSDNISSCQRCVILIDVPVLEHSNVLWNYGYMVLAVSLTFSTLTIIILYCLTLRMYWKAVPGFCTDRERQQLANMRTRLTLYTLVFIICWSPAMIISYHKWSRHPHYDSSGLFDVTKYFPLYVSQAVCAPLQGLLNSIVYGWTKKYFRRAETLISPVASSKKGDFRTPYYGFPSYASPSESANDTSSVYDPLVNHANEPGY